VSPSESNAGTSTRSVSWRPAAVCLVAALGLIGLFFVDAVAPTLARLEHWTADWRAALLSDKLSSSHPKLAIVTVNTETLKNFPFILPIDRGLQADIVSAVDRAGPKAIALDFYYTKKTVPDSDEKLLKALREAKAQIILGAYENVTEGQLNYQYHFIDNAKAKAGYLNLNPDRDGVVRFRGSPPDDVRFKHSFSELLAHAAGWQWSNPPQRIAWLLRPWDRSSTFLTIEAHNLLNGSATAVAAQLKDRVVIIAGDIPYFDRHRTPFSLLTEKNMSGSEIHAHMAAELIDGGRSYSELPPVQRDIFLAGLASVGILLGWQFRRRHFDFLDWRGVSIVVIAIDAMFFKFAHLVLPFTLAAYAWLLAVTFGTQFRDAIHWLAQIFRVRAKA
jgi:CHASE2 domain-containing sensor protein